jgi:hypothetical protein
MLSTDVPTLTEGQAVTFTALVTDPDGAQDIVGGALLDESGAVTFGPFVAASAGAFSFVLDWTRLNQVQPIEFTGQQPRLFRARFFDAASNAGEGTVSVTLNCGTGAACGGTCVDLMSNDSHCGACGAACLMNASVGGCANGQCANSWGECFTQGDGFASCDAYCSSIGQSCVANGCVSRTQWLYGSLDGCETELDAPNNGNPLCGDILLWVSTSDAARCCCTGGP